MKNSGLFRHMALLLFISLCAGMMYAQRPQINFDRPYNKTGLNVFEPANLDTVPYMGFKLRISGAFSQQYQALSQTNTADVIMKDNTLTSTPGDSVNLNGLYPLGNGFNLASANLDLDVQLADGIYMKLENYMSSRHHNEFWVKGGFIQIDKLPMFGDPQWFTDNFRIRLGDMEVNYGDAHFYRTDNANGIYNPFIGENIMDAFATEVAGELYYLPKDKGWIAMAGLSSGLLNGDIQEYPAPITKDPSIYGKIGYDKQINGSLRVRLTGSVYNNSGTIRNTLYGGDRAGSRFYLAGEPQYYISTGVLTAASASSRETSGRLDPGFSSELTSFMINPFIKWNGLEIFGTYEASSGDGKFSNSLDSVKRNFSQYAIQGVYRFLKNEQCYIGAKYNKATGRLYGYTDGDGDISIDRVEVAAGWFPTENLLVKVEYVTQSYDNFKSSDYRNGLNFKGVMVEASVGF